MPVWQKCSKEEYDTFWGPISDLRHSWKEWNGMPKLSAPEIKNGAMRKQNALFIFPPLIWKKQEGTEGQVEIFRPQLNLF